MNLPTIPTFVNGDTSITKLNQLSQAVSMLTVAADYPVWRFYGTGTQTLTVTSWNQMHVGSIAVDTDSTYVAPGTAKIVTQGYYECEACIPFVGLSSSFLAQGLFQFTAGSGNPNHTTGSQVYFGGAASWAAYSASGVDTTICISGKCPYVCYPLDTITVQVYAVQAGMIINNGQNATNTAGWFTPQFSGRWIRTGS
jgi:hypothetical protein